MSVAGGQTAKILIIVSPTRAGGGQNSWNFPDFQVFLIFVVALSNDPETFVAFQEKHRRCFRDLGTVFADLGVSHKFYFFVSTKLKKYYQGFKISIGVLIVAVSAVFVNNKS